MILETRLISNSNTFFTRESKAPVIVDEYEEMFKRDLIAHKKSLPTAISND